MEADRTMQRERWPLEPSGDEMRAMVDASMDRIVAYVEALPSAPAHRLDGAEDLARALREPLPEQGAALPELLDLIFDRAAATGFNTPGPGYLAYIPGGGVFHAALARLIADVVNRYVGIWLAAPGLVQLETNVLRWFADIVGYPEAALGILTSGGSLANFSAIVTARHERLPPDFLRGTLYVSDQTHHSVRKAALLAGFPEERVRVVGSDGAFRMRLDVLAERVREDRQAGLQPFLVVASGGTTNTGAVDDLAAFADFAHDEGLWLHVDAAYGGFFALTERGRVALRGIDRADSITLDPHKGLFLPYGTGSLLVRDGAALSRAHAVGAAYLPSMQEAPEFVDFCQLSPELSRPFRGLGVWLPFRLLGVQAFREALDEKLDLARRATEALHAMEGIEVVADPQLSVVAFRVAAEGMDHDARNAASRRLLDAVNRRGRVFLTATTVDGSFLVRICVLSFRTHADRIDACLDDIRAGLAEVLAERD
jgi:aromatic-L-amino-acid decarboxylase